MHTTMQSAQDVKKIHKTKNNANLHLFMMVEYKHV